MVLKGLLSGARRVGVEGSTFLVLVAFVVYNLVKVSTCTCSYNSPAVLCSVKILCVVLSRMDNFS